MRYLCLLYSSLLLGTVTGACAQTLLRVPESTWNALTEEERISLQKSFLIEPLSPSSFGLIIDNQGINKSTPESTSGSTLGQAIGSAAYIDNAFRPDGNYSAKTHLAAMLLGGVLGSALNRPSQNQFQFRYAIRLGDGNISYYDKISGDPFRHPAGVCVLLPAVSLSPDQSLCSLSIESIRTQYLAKAPSIKNQNPTIVTISPENSDSSQSIDQHGIPNLSNGTILCKIGHTAPVTTSFEKCISINGTIIK